MKKNLKKSLFGIFCASFVACGMLGAGFAVNSAIAEEESTAVELTSFKMMDGASIRKGTDNDNSTYGIRFSATFNDADEDKLGGYTVTAGTFIMAYDYIQSKGAISEATCFANDAIYWWKGKDDNATVPTGKTEILHVQGNWYDDSETGLNKLNGSVVNLYDINLDREYVGVSYLKLEKDETTQYIFASRDADDYRSPMQVSMNILKSTEETAQADKPAAEFYANKYLAYKGGAVTNTVKKNVYVNSSTGYSLDATKSGNSETLTIDSAMDFVELLPAVTAPVTPDGFVAVKGNGESATNATLNLASGVTTLSYYYDKTDMSNVIFDSSYATEGQTAFEANKVSISGGCADKMTETTNWGWHGNSAIRIDDYSNGWAKINFNEPKTFAPTKKISMMIKNEQLTQFHPETGDQDWPVYFIVYTPTRCDFINGINFEWNNEGAYEVTIEFSTEITQITAIEFCVDNAAYYSKDYPGGDGRAPYNVGRSTRSIYYIDYIHAEYELNVENISNLVATQADQEMSFSLPISSTVYSDAELEAYLANSEIVVEAQKLASSDAAITLTENNGTYSLTVPAETNYAINWSVVNGRTTNSGSFYALGYYKNMVDDYESYNVGDVLKDNTYVVVEGGIDNGKAMKITSSADAWPRYNVNVTLDGSYTTLCLWIYSPTAKNFANDLSFELWDQDNAWQNMTAGFSVKAGWNYIEVEMRKAFTGVLGIDTNPRYWVLGSMIDRIAFK